VVRTNLLASSYCIEAALPLLRKGTAPHLVGVASSVTYLPLPGPKPTARRKPGCAICSNRCVSIWHRRHRSHRGQPRICRHPADRKNDFPMP
jgi:NAD(P)-dependent dehydrogenase (short-subunit alcohol dehydrogenase family)